MSEQDIKLESGLYLIATADEGIQTIVLKEAVKRLKELIHVRENIPF